MEQVKTNNTKCYRHPGIETRLKCAECDRYICGHCARQTPVATKCAACLNEVRPAIFKLTLADMLGFSLIALVIGATFGVGATYIVDLSITLNLIRAFIALVFLLSPITARFIIRRAFQRKSITLERAIAIASITGLALTVLTFCIFGYYVRDFSGTLLQRLLLNFYVIAGVAAAIFFIFAEVFRRRR